MLFSSTLSIIEDHKQLKKSDHQWYYTECTKMGCLPTKTAPSFCGASRDDYTRRQFYVFIAQHGSESVNHLRIGPMAAEDQ